MFASPYWHTSWCFQSKWMMHFAEGTFWCWHALCNVLISTGYFHNACSWHGFLFQSSFSTIRWLSSPVTQVHSITTFLFSCIAMFWPQPWSTCMHCGNLFATRTSVSSPASYDDLVFFGADFFRDKLDNRARTLPTALDALAPIFCDIVGARFRIDNCRGQM